MPSLTGRAAEISIGVTKMWSLAGPCINIQPMSNHFPLPTAEPMWPGPHRGPICSKRKQIRGAAGTPTFRQRRNIGSNGFSFRPKSHRDHQRLAPLAIQSKFNLLLPSKKPTTFNPNENLFITRVMISQYGKTNPKWELVQKKLCFGLRLVILSLS